MRIDRRLVLIGVMLVVLSMTMATQYATTKISYSYGIVHPSNADIRFIGSDNASSDDDRCLRVVNNASGTRFLTLELGDWFPNSQKNYSAAFGIVNEEPFALTITHINMTSTVANTYVDVWLHANRELDYPLDGGTKVLAIDNGVAQFTGSSSMWVLGAGDGDASTMNASAANISTPWDGTSGIRYSVDNTDVINGTSDFVWIGVSLNVLSNAPDTAEGSGTIYIHFKAETTT